MVSIPRSLVHEVLGQAARGLSGALLGTADPAEVRGLAAGGPAGEGGPAHIGDWRPAPGGPAKPGAGEFPPGRPGFLVLVVAVRDGSPAEWAFWRMDGGRVVPVTVRITA